VLLAYLKLRQRNLGPILDATGWAINTKAMMNVPFGTSLTSLAKLPSGSERNLDDPYAVKKRPWRLYLVLATLAIAAYLWSLGKLDPYLPEPARYATRFPKAPATTPPTPVAPAPAPPAPTPPAPTPAPAPPAVPVPLPK
jgi:hypothetical protein